MSELTEAQLSAEIAGLEQLLEAGDVEVLRALEPLLRCTTADEVLETLADGADALGALVEQRAAWAETLADYELQLEALTSDGTAETTASDETAETAE